MSVLQTAKPDPALAAQFERMSDDFPFFARNMLKIRTKSGDVIPFKLNRAQIFLHDRLEKQLQSRHRVRAVIVKGRQLGISTYLQGRYYWRLWRSKKQALRAFILTHEDRATQNLFSMAQRFHDLMPVGFAPPTAAANAKELVFADTGCGYVVATAGTKEVGRSDTIQLLHGCLSLETQAIEGDTSRLKPMGEFQVGDFVRTHTGQIAPIKYISEQRKSVREMRLRGIQTVPLDASDEHRFWTKAGWRTLASLEPGDAIGFPVEAITDEIQSLPFKTPVAIRPQGGGSQESVPDNVALTYELGRVLGLYLAEGYVDPQYRRDRMGRVIFAVHRREVDRTLEWLEPFSGLFKSVTVQHSPNSLTTHVKANGMSFATFVAALCGRGDEKRFPDKWRRMGPEFGRGIVHGYLAGDGHCSTMRDRRIRLSSVRSATVVALRDALAALGYGWASISYREAAIRGGRDEQAQWTLSVTGDGVEKLAPELGWTSPIRQRRDLGNYGTVQIEDGFAWLPIVELGEPREATVRDFEVDHPDHSYCVAHGASHNSEVPSWPNAADHIAGLFQALSKGPGSESVLEATAKGIGNVFHRLAMAAVRNESDYEAIFIPWFWGEDYETPCPAKWADSMPSAWHEYAVIHKLSYEQLYWAWLTNRELAQAKSLSTDEPCPDFRQEYPATFDEAFQSSGNSFIPALSVLRARQKRIGSDIIVGRGPIILGVDPARSADNVGIVDRCGRVMGERICEAWAPDGDTVFLAQRLARIIDRIRPDAVNIDMGGNGAGLYDILKDKGYGYCLNAVNFGSNPIGVGPTGDEMYANRRAEMYDLLRDWFETPGGVQVPDSDALHTDLTAAVWGPGATRYTDATNELVIEPKDKIKLRLGASPDLGDAAALTFAVPFAQGMQAQNQPVPKRRANARTGY